MVEHKILRQNSTSISERERDRERERESPREFKEKWKDVSLRLILKGKDGHQDCFLFCWFQPGSWDILNKEGLPEKRGRVLEVVLPGRGSNDLPRRRKDLPGRPDVGEKYTD